MMVSLYFWHKHFSTKTAHNFQYFFRNFSSSRRFLSEVTGNNHKNNYYDVIITGGGMVGTAMAAALGNSPVFSNKRMLLLESGHQILLEKPPEKYNSRVCALSNATKKLLSSFGAWENILRLQNVKHMKVWDSCSDVGISFNYTISPYISELAYIVENDLIVSSIVRQLVKTRADVRYNSKVKYYNLNNNEHKTHSSDWSSVVLDDGDVFYGKLLIGADGVNSLLRRSANMETVGWSYHQSAVVAVVQFSGEIENNTAWQRFMPTGPVALLPLSDEFSCLIWTTTTDHAKELVNMNAQSFLDSVNNTFCSDSHHNETIASIARGLESFLTATGIGESSVRQLPPKILQFDLDSRKSFPLGLSHARHYVKPRLALIGDAAHRVHPLSGQGVNLGFGDVACLIQVLEDAVLRGADIGCISNLTAFETERQRRVLPMMATIDALDRFYSNEFVPLVLLRSVGCQVANSLPFIKDGMVRFAAR